MAFHQPTRQQTQRVLRPLVDEEEIQRLSQRAASPVEQSQTWVLFAPPTDAGTTTSYLSATRNTESTPGRSQLGDLGSIDTAGPSGNSINQQQSTSFVNGGIEEEEDAELDSLDSHLPEFRSSPDFVNSSQGLAQTTPVLPAHDGLGSFRIDQEGMGPDVQDRLYAFEQFNPRRAKRRRASLELAQADLDDEQQQLDKMRRIELWRLEHSRYLLQEIQKETRRRTRSMASASSARRLARKPEDVATFETGFDANVDPLGHEDAWHDQNASDPAGGHQSIWGRIAHKVIRNLMGIDERVLSVIFGDTLPDEDDSAAGPKISSILRETSPENVTEVETETGWQLRLLERIATELGLFINHISEHPGAFSTFTRVQQMPIPYAGLPPIPESAMDLSKTSNPHDAATTAMSEFKPTIAPDLVKADTSRHPAPSSSHHQSVYPQSGGTFTQEEWERDLDVRLVFRYLRSRFMPRPSSSGGIANSHLATSSTQDTAMKAARVRQNHPLISRTRPSERRSFRAAAPPSPVLLRRASSCASQSSRKSVRRSSCSSRHYWDIGAGSVGTGSMIAAAGAMGSWGEI